MEEMKIIISARSKNNSFGEDVGMEMEASDYAALTEEQFLEAGNKLLHSLWERLSVVQSVT